MGQTRSIRLDFTAAGVKQVPYLPIDPGDVVEFVPSANGTSSLEGGLSPDMAIAGQLFAVPATPGAIPPIPVEVRNTSELFINSGGANTCWIYVRKPSPQPNASAAAGSSSDMRPTRPVA